MQHHALCLAQNVRLAQNSTGIYSTAEAIQGLLALTDASTIIDVTYGNGKCWDGFNGKVIRADLNPTRALDVQCNFQALPFEDGSVDAVVYDPPFHPNVGTIHENRFATMGNNEHELKEQFVSGLLECHRVARKWVVVKCQNYIHNHKPQWMVLWAIAACGEPFEWLTAQSRQKITSGRWKSRKSLRHNESTYLLFCKRGNHR